jgi:hypothetical protein
MLAPSPGGAPLNESGILMPAGGGFYLADPPSESPSDCFCSHWLFVCHEGDIRDRFNLQALKSVLPVSAIGDTVSK